MLSEVLFLCLLAPGPDATGEPPPPPSMAHLRPARAEAPPPQPAAPLPTSSPLPTVLTASAGARAAADLDRIFHPHPRDIPLGISNDVCSVPLPPNDNRAPLLARDVAAALRYAVHRYLSLEGESPWEKRRRYERPEPALAGRKREKGHPVVSVASLF
jgi:hypothetical protein